MESPGTICYNYQISNLSIDCNTICEAKIKKKNRNKNRDEFKATL